MPLVAQLITCGNLANQTPCFT